jgi:hypothetical protein
MLVLTFYLTSKNVEKTKNEKFGIGKNVSRRQRYILDGNPHPTLATLTLKVESTEKNGKHKFLTNMTQCQYRANTH